MAGVSETAQPAAPGAASPWMRWSTDELVTVRLVRHGQTSSYETDAGLTERGHRQAFDKGYALAAELRDGARVVLPHAPTARARETALALHDGLQQGYRDVPAADVRVDKPHVDVWFDNFRLWCDGQALDPTQAYRTYQRVRERTPAGELPGWFAEADRFYAIMAGDGDPIRFWLNQPVQHFEPAAMAVRRFWTGIHTAVHEAPSGRQVVVSTHSGCIRAVATAAFGYDPGEPDNVEHVGITLPPTADRAVVGYRGHSVEQALPVNETPPWCPEWANGRT